MEIERGLGEDCMRTEGVAEKQEEEESKRESFWVAEREERAVVAMVAIDLSLGN